MALAWKRGADPYRLYNALDADYRPLSLHHPCPECWSVSMAVAQNAPEVNRCHLCGGRRRVEIPLAEPGEPLLPPHPGRIRSFIYGCAKALAETESGEKPG